MFVAPLLLAALVQQPTILPPPAPALPAVARDTSPFRRLDLPAPNLVREGSGRPGPRYWQQRADYTINVALDTATHTVAGDETIRYTAANAPLQEHLTAEDVGGTAAFLCSPLGAGITGTVIFVDKGYHTMGKATEELYAVP